MRAFFSLIMTLALAGCGPTDHPAPVPVAVYEHPDGGAPRRVLGLSIPPTTYFDGTGTKIGAAFNLRLPAGFTGSITNGLLTLAGGGVPAGDLTLSGNLLFDANGTRNVGSTSALAQYLFANSLTNRATTPTFALDLLGGGASIAALAQPGTVTIVTTGAGAGTQTYKCVWFDKFGYSTTASAVAGSTGGTGPTTLDASHYNDLTCPTVTGGAKVLFWRVSGGATQGRITAAAGQTGNTLRDNGIVAVAYTAPTHNATADVATGAIVSTSTSTDNTEKQFLLRLNGTDAVWWSSNQGLHSGSYVGADVFLDSPQLYTNTIDLHSGSALTVVPPLIASAGLTLGTGGGTISNGTNPAMCDATGTYCLTTAGGTAKLLGAGGAIYVASGAQAWISTTDFSPAGGAGTTTLGASNAFGPITATSHVGDGTACLLSELITADTSGITAQKVVVWSGAGKAQNAGATLSLTTIAGVALTTAASGAQARVCKIGRAVVNTADAACTAGALASTSAGTAGSVQCVVAVTVLGGGVGRISTAQSGSTATIDVNAF